MNKQVIEMTANKEIIYWRSDENWYIYDQKSKTYRLTDKAPERAVKSFALLKDHYKNRL
jgi:hypothetical protein